MQPVHSVIVGCFFGVVALSCSSSSSSPDEATTDSGVDSSGKTGDSAVETGLDGSGGSAGTAGAGGSSGSGGAGGSGGASTMCTQCHGSGTDPAPPLDTKGNTETSFPGVGAHQSHLAISDWHMRVQCSECHKIPSDAAPGDLHRNGVDDIVWGSIAKSGTFDSADFSCSGSYCHGATLPGDKAGAVSIRVPIWTIVDGSQKACGSSCHTLPPASPHAASSGCHLCHEAVISSFTPGDPPQVVWADSNLHINGKVEIPGGGVSCTSCHGDPVSGNPAPPLGTQGETETSSRAVGAHAAHLAVSSWHRTGICADCHMTPISMIHSNTVVDLTWGKVSTAQGASPAFVEADFSCTNTYCHGTTLSAAKDGGKVNRTPVWVGVNGTFNACGTTCHTNPPGGSHPLGENCEACHGAVISSFKAGTNSAIWAKKELHINGVVESSP